MPVETTPPEQRTPAWLNAGQDYGRQVFEDRVSRQEQQMKKAVDDAAAAAWPPAVAAPASPAERATLSPMELLARGAPGLPDADQRLANKRERLETEQRRRLEAAATASAEAVALALPLTDEQRAAMSPMDFLNRGSAIAERDRERAAAALR
ncbi:MAG TPA: hypothetical protein VF624_04140 [Tepidisphaeraceae bacterium]|jgi:hypothetical protein